MSLKDDPETPKPMEHLSVEGAGGKRPGTSVRPLPAGPRDRNDTYRALVTSGLFNQVLAEKMNQPDAELKKMQNLLSHPDNLSAVLAHKTVGKNGKEKPAASGGKPAAEKSGATKYGWIRGVLMRCVLNIFSGMLFLRLSWVVGQGGLLSAIGIVLIASVVTVLTTFAMSAIATNGQISGGGVYFLISRSLGPRFGGSIGLVFGIANAIAVAMHSAALAETLRDSHIMTSSFYGVLDKVSWVRVIGTGVLVLVILCCSVGLLLESIVQILMLIILSLSIGVCLIGPFVFTTDKMYRGYTNMSMATLTANLLPPKPETGEVTPFHELFAIFFPAATGILAGANISGDLRDPGLAIPKGTLLAIAITSGVYILMGALCAACVVQRDMVNLSRYIVRGRLVMELIPKVLRQRVIDQLDMMGKSVADLPSINISSAPIGLADDRQIYLELSLNSYIVEAGIYAAAFSSALACMVSAPKILQAVVRDQVFSSKPWIVKLSKGYGSNNEPILLYLVSFGIAVTAMQIGKLDVVAMIVSCLFLLNYCLVCWACFDADQGQSPGWRPSFRYYHKSLSFIGFLVSAACMFAVSWWGAAAAIFIVFCCYMWVVYRDPDINWGTSRQAAQYMDALRSVLRLRAVREHVKNYRPQVLVLSGYLADRPGLIDLAQLITYNQSLLVCGTVVTRKDNSLIGWQTSAKALQHYLKERGVKAVYQQVHNNDFRQGCQALMQLSGLGNLRCNVVMFGFHRKWRQHSYRKVLDLYNIILDAFYLGFGVIIVCARVNIRENIPSDVLDEITKQMSQNAPTVTQLMEQAKNVAEMQLQQQEEQATGMNRVWHAMRSVFGRQKQASYAATLPLVMPWSAPNDHRADDRRLSAAAKQSSAKSATHGMSAAAESTDGVNFGYLKMPAIDNEEVKLGVGQTVRSQNRSRPNDQGSTGAANTNAAAIQRWISDGLPKAVERANLFRRQQTGTIDVYWIHKDGGLGVLVPYLIQSRPLFNNCKLRIFSVCYDHEDKKAQQKELQQTLDGFRIKAADIRVFPCLTNERLSDADMYEFMEFVKPLIKNESDSPEAPNENDSEEPLIREFTKQHLLKHRTKTQEIICLRNCILHNSSDAALVSITFRPPKKDSSLLHPSLYMAWLEFLTAKLPPTLLIRGNQEQVMTEMA